MTDTTTGNNPGANTPDDNESIQRRLAKLPEPQRKKILASLDDETLDAVLSSWRFTARPDQIPPDIDPPFVCHLLLGGRGSGKSRAECEWAHERIIDYARWATANSVTDIHRIGAGARTNADIRETLVEGESGLIAVAEARDIPAKYQPSKKRIEYPEHGARITLFSAEEPDSARGPQYHTVIGDEFGAWDFTITDEMGNNLWTNLLFGLRLPSDAFSPQALLATTPKRIPILRDMVAKCQDDDNHEYTISAMTTLDNAGNLDPVFLNNIIAQYEGTNLYRQEVLGLLLEDDEYALWSEESITRAHRFIDNKVNFPEYGKIVIGVDPPGGLTRDHCGIIAVALLASPLPGKRHQCVAVVADRSMRGSPSQWGQRVVALARELGTRDIYAEQNQGFEMVRTVIANEDTSGYCNVHLVNASDGKEIRAEPVAQLYEQGRAAHVERFPLLEDEMVMFSRGAGTSPDRMDALVHAVTALLPQIHAKPATVSSATDVQIDRAARAVRGVTGVTGVTGQQSMYGQGVRGGGAAPTRTRLGRY